MRGGYWRSQFWQWDDFESFDYDVADFAFVMGHRDPRPVFTQDNFDVGRREPPTLVAEVDFLPAAALDAESFVFPAARETIVEPVMSTYRGLEVFAPEASLIEAGARCAEAAPDSGAIGSFAMGAETPLSPPDWLLLG